MTLNKDWGVDEKLIRNTVRCSTTNSLQGNPNVRWHFCLFHQSSITSALSVAVQQKRFTHAESVLYVHQPAIKAVIVADLDQFSSHWLIGFFISQEGFAGRGSIVPLCDESPWNENSKLVIFYSGGSCDWNVTDSYSGSSLNPGSGLSVHLFYSPSTMTPFLWAALVHTAGGIVTRLCAK